VSDTTTVLVLGPSVSVLPVVSIVAATTIGDCSSFSLDFSSSSGAAGRRWQSMLIDVINDVIAENMELETYLNAATSVALSNVHSASSVIIIPHELLDADRTYTFTVTLCNFLLVCGVGIHSVFVSSESSPLVAWIAGDSTITMSSKDPLLLNVYALIERCDESISHPPIDLQWSAVQISTTTAIPLMVSLPSVSQDVSLYKLGRYTLTANSHYQISVVVTQIASPYLTTTAGPINVFITEGAVVAVISGGSSITVARSTSFTIDASASYDEDLVTGVTGNDAGLSFHWSCMQTLPFVLSQSQLLQDVDSSYCALFDHLFDVDGNVIDNFLNVNSYESFNINTTLLRGDDATVSSSFKVKLTVLARFVVYVTRMHPSSLNLFC
jgi:hypothetical protein